MDPQGEKRERISKGKGLFLLSVAFLFDLVQGLLNLIPFVGWIASSFLGIIGILLFFLWFKVLGVTFSDNMNKYLISTVVNLIGIIPILGALPERFVGTLFIVRAIRKEDVDFNKKQEEERRKTQQKETSATEDQKRRVIGQAEEEKMEKILLFQRTQELKKSVETSYAQSKKDGEQEVRTIQTLQSIGIQTPKKAPGESLRRLAPRHHSTEVFGEIGEKPLERYTLEKQSRVGSVPDEFRLRRISARDIAEENQKKRNLLKKQKGAFAQKGEPTPTEKTPRGVTILDKLRQAEVA